MQADEARPNTALEIGPGDLQQGVLLSINKDGAVVEWQPSDEIMDIHGEDAVQEVKAKLSQVWVHQGLEGGWKAVGSDVPASAMQAVEFKFNKRFAVPAAGEAFSLPPGLTATRVKAPGGQPILVLTKGTLNWWGKQFGRVDAFGRDRANLRPHVTRESMRGEDGLPLPKGAVPHTPQEVWCTARKHPRFHRPDAENVTGPGGAGVRLSAQTLCASTPKDMEVDEQPGSTTKATHHEEVDYEDEGN